MESSEIGQKMRAAFEATAPSDEEVLRRYGGLLGLRSAEDLPAAARLAESPLARARRRRSVGRVVSVGVGALLAAASVLLVWSLTMDRPVAIGPSLERDLRVRRERGSVPARSPALQGDGDGSTRASGPEQTVLPARAREARAAGVRSEGPRAEGQPGEPAALPAGDLGPEPKAETEASWARVTEAMKKRDWTGAHAALAPLLDSADRETKDSARLVRVRLELSAAPSKSTDARWLVELEDLAKAGSTSSIRASARRLLETLQSESN